MAGHGSEQVACSWIPEIDCVIFRTAGNEVGVVLVIVVIGTLFQGIFWLLVSAYKLRKTV